MLHLHSIMRYAVLGLLLFAIFRSLLGLINKKEFTNGDNKTGLYLMMFTHIQLILGLIVYYTQGWLSAPFAESMKDPIARFWKVEHIFAMLIAVTLITIGRIRSKKAAESMGKHRISLIFYGISLLIVMWAIPWDMTRLF